MADVRRVLIEIDADTGDVVGGIASVNKQLQTLGSTAKVTTGQVNKAAAAMQTNLAGAAGIAGATVTEFGRLVSDLPYGIQAVTNNLSQLGNMFAVLVIAAGGLQASFTALWTAMMGPVGVLVAFQAVVAGIELYSQAQRRAKKDTEDLKKSIDEINESFGDQQAILEALGRAAIYSPEAKEALAKNMKEVKAYLEAAESVGEVTPQVIDEAVRLGMALLEARKNAAIEQQEYLKLVKDETTTETERIQAGTDLADALAAVEAAEKALNLQKQEAVVVTAKLKGEEEELLGARRFAVFGKDLIDGPELTETQKIAEEALGKVGAAAIKGFQDRIKSEGERNPFVDLLGISEETFDNTMDQIQQGMNAAFDLMNAQFERELALEERKTIALNDQLKSRLANEQLTADARDKINQEIARNEAELVKKQNAIEKKRFQLNKAQGVANAGINTAVGVTKALAETNVPLAAFIGALGAVQIATILAQTFTPKPMPTPNLTGPGAAGAEIGGPEFNVIGGSGRSQLAEAIAGTQQQPVKAYVVSSEVSSAQELDRKIVVGASI